MLGMYLGELTIHSIVTVPRGGVSHQDTPSVGIYLHTHSGPVRSSSPSKVQNDRSIHPSDRRPNEIMPMKVLRPVAGNADPERCRVASTPGENPGMGFFPLTKILNYIQFRDMAGHTRHISFSRAVSVSRQKLARTRFGHFIIGVALFT